MPSRPSGCSWPKASSRKPTGAYRPVGDLGDLAVPETLHALIAARLDALDPGDRALLQDASVLGQTFTIDGPGGAASRIAEVLEARLRGLVRREILVLDTDPRSPERGQYGFAQALLREVAYSTLARTRPAGAAPRGGPLLRGARATSRWPASWRPTTSMPTWPRPTATMAARSPPRPVLPSVERPSAPGALGSNDQAIAYLERALTITSDPADEADLLGRLGGAADLAAHFELAETALRRVVEIHRERGDRPALAGAVVALGRALSSAYRIDDALAVLEPAYAELSPELSDDPSLISLMAALARAYQLHEEPARAVEWADRALVPAERLYLVPVLADAITTKGGSMAVLGRVWEGLGLVRAGRMLADANGLTTLSLRAAISLTGHLAVHDPRGATEVSREAFDLSRRLGLRHMAVITAANGGEASLQTGEWAWALEALHDAGSAELESLDRAAIELVELEILAARGDDVSGRLKALSAAHDLNDPVYGSSIALTELWSALADGRLADARRHGQRAGELSRLNRPYGLLWAAYAATRERDLDEARRLLAELVALSVRGPALDAERMALEAAIAALDDRWRDAVGLFTEATRALRELGVSFDVGLILLNAAALAPEGDPFGEAAAAESRAVFAGLGSAAFLRQLDEVEATRPALGSKSASRSTADDASALVSLHPLPSREAAPSP